MSELRVHVVVSSGGYVSGVYTDVYVAERHAQSLRESRDGFDYEVSTHVVDE